MNWDICCSEKEIFCDVLGEIRHDHVYMHFRIVNPRRPFPRILTRANYLLQRNRSVPPIISSRPTLKFIFPMTTLKSIGFQGEFGLHHDKNTAP